MLGGLGRDVDGADGLSVGVECRARVLALIAGSDGLDQQGNRAGHVIVQHLVFVVPCSNNFILSHKTVEYCHLTSRRTTFDLLVLISHYSNPENIILWSIIKESCNLFIWNLLLKFIEVYLLKRIAVVVEQMCHVLGNLLKSKLNCKVNMLN